MVNDLFGKMYLSSKALLSILSSCPRFSNPTSGFRIYPGGIHLVSMNFSRCFLSPFNLPKIQKMITVSLSLLAKGDQCYKHLKN